MKLYLTEILKEANALGFGAPGQGGNSSDVNMPKVAPTMSQPTQPAMQGQPSAGGMMMPNLGGTNGMGFDPNSPQFKQQLSSQSFKAMI